MADPARVGLFTEAIVNGTIKAGVAPTAKHFPGHGDTHVDSHLGLPRIAKTRAQLASAELIPFRSLVAAGVPSVMTGHMALPLVTGGNTPASLSREITTGILREEMGFKGVVVTDCLEMDAVAQSAGVPPGAVRALEAGADVVMICHTYALQDAAIREVYAAVADGRIGLAELREGGARVGAMKARFASGDDAAAPDEWAARFAYVHEESLRLSREAYPRSTTVVWNAGVIPLSSSRPVVLLTPRVEAVNRAVDPGDGTLVGENGVRNTAGAAYLAFASALEKRGAVRHVVFEEDGEIAGDLFDGAGGVIWVMRNADVKRWQLACLERLDLRAKKLPVVLVSSCGPYDLVGKRAEYADWTAYVATYEFTAAALETLAAVVFGEVEGKGRVPVAI